jgi:hypothetical protein
MGLGYCAGLKQHLRTIALGKLVELDGRSIVASVGPQREVSQEPCKLIDLRAGVHCSPLHGDPLFLNYPFGSEAKRREPDLLVPAPTRYERSHNQGRS